MNARYCQTFRKNSIWFCYLKTRRSSQSTSFGGWKELCVLKALFDVNNVSDTVFVETFAHQLIPRPVNIFSFDHFCIWVDILLMTEINQVLSFLDAADNGACNCLLMHHERQLHDWMRIDDATKLDKSAALCQNWQISVQVVLARNGVQNDITSEGICLYLLWVLRDDEDVGTFLHRHCFLFVAHRNRDDLVAHGFGKFYTHRSEATDADNTDGLATITAVPVDEWSVHGDTSAHDRCDLLHLHAFMNLDDVVLMNHIRAGVATERLVVLVSANAAMGLDSVVSASHALIAVLLLTAFAHWALSA